MGVIQELRRYAPSDLPSVDTGAVVFDDFRRVISWWDGDNWEWPTFVDNNDVQSSEVLVENTTDETEVYRSGLDPSALVQDRVLIFRLFGKYGTGSSNDDFTLRLKAGESGFDAIAGGSEVASVTTVQENVDPGSAWQSKITLTVVSTGKNGSISGHEEGAFNNNKKDGHVEPVTIDTTTAEEFAATIEWNQAKADNTATVRPVYTQLSA